MKTIEHIRRKDDHASFSPSSSKRVTTCPASFALHREQGSTADAALGTVAHHIHERVLNGTLAKAHDAIGEVHVVDEGDQKFEFTVDIEMAEAVAESTELVFDLIASLKREGQNPVLFVEVKANISAWTPIEDQFGTSDVIILCDNKLIVIDYKHGSGVKVDADNNTQMALYALGAWQEYKDWCDIEFVEMRIHQPRIKNFQVWSILTDQLLAFGDKIKERFTLAIEHDAPFGPSQEACVFCSAKPTCPALAKLTEKLLEGVFDDLDADVKNPKEPYLLEKKIEVPSLNPEQLSYLWQKKKLITGFFEAVQAECEHRLLHGEPVPGLKLVEGRGSREWTDEIAARQKLEALGVKKSDIIKVVLVSPAQADDLVTKSQREELAELVKKNKGKPTVALASDKRSEWINPAEAAFDDLDADDTGL